MTDQPLHTSEAICPFAPAVDAPTDPGAEPKILGRFTAAEVTDNLGMPLCYRFVGRQACRLSGAIVDGYSSAEGPGANPARIANAARFLASRVLPDCAVYRRLMERMPDEVVPAT
jgi:hypothetical protein